MASHDKIRRLCTRVGAIMEDASVVALIWDDGLDPATRLDQLAEAAARITTLIAAAQTELRRA